MKNQGLVDLGLKPHYLTDDVLGRLLARVFRYRGAIDPARTSRACAGDR